MTTNNILIIGSNRKTSIERMYLSALLDLNVENVEVFDTDFAVFSYKYCRPLNPVLRLFQSRALHNRMISFFRKRGGCFDAVIVFKGFYFSPELLSCCRDLSNQAVWVNFNPDDPFNMSHGISNLNILNSLQLYDLHASWSEAVLRKIEEKGARNVFYLPFGFDSHIHIRHCMPSDFNRERLCFIGSWDADREQMLSSLDGFDLRIYGNGWNRVGRRSKLRKRWARRELVGPDIAKAVGTSAININILRRQNYGAHNMRTFEVPSMGGMMLATRSENQQDFFEEGKEADYFSTEEELLEKVKYYLEHSNRIEQIRERCYERSQRSSYSYTARAKSLLDVVNRFRNGERGFFK